MNHKMKPGTNAVSSRRTKSFEGQGPNWVLIAGGALLSTLSVRLGYKLKQILDMKQPENNSCPKGNGRHTSRKRSGNCQTHPNMYCFAQDEECFNSSSGSEVVAEIKTHRNTQLVAEPALPLVTVSAPDQLELPQKPFHYLNCSESPSCVSESGSDIFSKQEVIQKLRHQLKRRDDMILEMHDQINELQTSLSTQISHSAHLQSLLDGANRDLFDSEREIQKLRKAIVDHCIVQAGRDEKSSNVPGWLSEGRNEHANGNGYLDVVDGSLDYSEKGRVDEERIEMLKKEVGELKEVIDGKEYLLQSYKEHKTELSLKIKELQQRLDSQLPNIL